MRPATAVTNKHLLPVYGPQGAIPMIFYPISTLVRSGVSEILIISSKEHSGSIIQNLGDGFNFGAKFSYRIQDVNRVEMGIASALKLAKDFTGSDPFAVILGDNFFEDEFKNEFDEFVNATKQEAQIFLKSVDDPERFGVYHDGRIEEKPSHPKSNMAVSGLYLYHDSVYKMAENLMPSGRGELEITDINQNYCERQSMRISHVKGFWSDMGTPASIIRTQAFVAANNYSVFTTQPTLAVVQQEAHGFSRG